MIFFCDRLPSMPSKESRSTKDDPDGIFPRRGTKGKPVHRRLLADYIPRSTTLSRGIVGRIEAQTRKDGNGGIDPDRIKYPLVVVDTGVVARGVATKPQTDCWEVIEACLAEKYTPCVTKPIVREYWLIIRRETLDGGIYFDQNSNQLLKKFLTHCLVLVGNPTILPLQVSTDRSDQKFVITQALAQEIINLPCYLVSLDKDLLKIGPAQETNILHPATFLSSLTAGLLAL